MDAGLAAILGASVVACGAFAVALIQARVHRADRAEDARTQLINRRLDAYVDLLTAARELRFVAIRTLEGAPHRPDDQVDSIRTAISSAY